MPAQIPVMNDGNVVAKASIDRGGAQDAAKTLVPRSKSAVLHRSLHQDPLRVTSAKGHYLHLSNGQRIFDASGGAAVACIGHGNDRYRKSSALCFET